MTAAEAMVAAAARLRAAGVPDPARDARVLLAHAARIDAARVIRDRRGMRFVIAGGPCGAFAILSGLGPHHDRLSRGSPAARANPGLCY